VHLRYLCAPHRAPAACRHMLFCLRSKRVLAYRPTRVPTAHAGDSACARFTCGNSRGHARQAAGAATAAYCGRTWGRTSLLGKEVLPCCTTARTVWPGEQQTEGSHNTRATTYPPLFTAPPPFVASDLAHAYSAATILRSLPLPPRHAVSCHGGSRTSGYVPRHDAAHRDGKTKDALLTILAPYLNMPRGRQGATRCL